ncbi:hypothetical protein GN330_21705 [Nitratireductor sp. CAU 1489]|uniref:Uncharacterized protein n=1 Tax=Nitratireductor arenosus TaxID=2682096 RepID=A0A844QJV3_9HYPH|nr:hypothetical protein [Nitratireductor arenosus]MVA99872.1 hypothetical protein [Nitratireductor arenosus]
MIRGDRLAADLEENWMDALRADPALGATALRACTPEFKASLETIQEAFRGAARDLKEFNDRGTVDRRRLFQRYVKGGAWIVCDLDVVERGTDKAAALACFYPHPAVGEDVPISIFPRHGDPSHLRGTQKQPVLVDVAELIQDPEGVPLPTLVSLNFIDEDVLNGYVARSEAPGGPHLTGEAICIVGKWEPRTIGLAGMWVGKRYDEIIEGTAQIPNGVTYQGVDALGGLMERIKNNFNASFPLIRFKSQSVEVCRQKGVDLSLYVRNVIACAV